MAAALAYAFHDIDHRHLHDDQFDDLVTSMQANFTAALSAEEFAGQLFTTDATGLFDLFLSKLPVEQRQYHTCNCCRQFVERFGGLAVISPGGQLHSPIWNFAAPVPQVYSAAVTAMRNHIATRLVTGVFRAKEVVWGTPFAGGWTHFNLRPLSSILHTDRLKTPYQVMAAKLEDRRTLLHGLLEFSYADVKKAVNLLKSDALYRGEKVLGSAEFLLEMHEIQRSKRRDLASNLIWRAVATAPVGFCQPRSSMLGTLLEDIKSGMDSEAIKRRFAQKMNPTIYARPQVAPSAGNIAAAEKIVAQLGIEGSLKRRYAQFLEVPKIWMPRFSVGGTNPHPFGSVFDGVVPKMREPFTAPTGAAEPITFEKFRRIVMPQALRMQVLMEYSMNFVGILTAVDMDAPPIIQWDDENNRVPFSWYVYQGGSSPAQWGLSLGAMVDVAGIALQPSTMAGEDRFAHQGKSAFLILPEARDQSRSMSSGLFPEILKSELHSVRSTIEAYSRRTPPLGADVASANGIRVGSKGHQAVIEVTTRLGRTRYRIDRWD